MAHLPAAATAAAGQMTLDDAATDGHLVEPGRHGGAGNLILWHSDIQDAQGDTCIRLDAAGHRLCHMTIQHDGRAALIVSGVQPVKPATSVLAIVGGTGEPEGATGTVRSTPGEERRLQVRDRLADRTERGAGHARLPVARASAGRGAELTPQRSSVSGPARQ